MIEVLIPVAIVAAMLLVIVVTQSVALSQHKKEIERLLELARYNRNAAQDNAAEAMARESARFARSEASNLAARGMPGVNYPSARDYRQRDRLRAMQDQGIGHAPQAQGDNGLGHFALGKGVGRMLNSTPDVNAPPHDACVSPPQAPSVESTGPSPSCEVPSTSSSGGIE